MFSGSSPITSPHSLRKRTRSQGPFLHQRYPASTGTTPLSDSRVDRCQPASLRPLPSPATGLPRLRDPLSRRAVPLTPVDQSRCICRLLPRTVLPSPVLRPGRHPRLPFRGLLRLYTRYGPSICSTARSGLCRGASIPPVTQPHRPPATGPTDHCPGGTSTHKVIAPFGAHRRSRRATECHRDYYALRAERHFHSRWLSVALNLGDLRVEPCFAARAPLPRAFTLSP